MGTCLQVAICALLIKAPIILGSGLMRVTRNGRARVRRQPDGDGGSLARSSFANAALIGASARDVPPPVGSTRRTANPGKRADELTHRGLLPFVLYLTKTNRDIKQPLLAGQQRALVRFEAFEEEVNRRTRSPRDLSRKAVDAMLVVINLL
jgi:hypothetical protein